MFYINKTYFKQHIQSRHPEHFYLHGISKWDLKRCEGHVRLSLPQTAQQPELSKSVPLRTPLAFYCKLP